MQGLSLLAYLPDDVSIAQNGTMRVVAEGAKTGRIAIMNGVLDDSNAGANPYVREHWLWRGDNKEGRVGSR